MRILAITGLSTSAKRLISLKLVETYLAEGKAITLLDNNDLPIEEVSVPYFRLRGGCVCCSLAGQLIPKIHQLDTEQVILPVSMQADPESLQGVLSQLGVVVQTLAYVDQKTEQTTPYLTQRLKTFADITISQVEDWNAALRL